MVFLLKTYIAFKTNFIAFKDNNLNMWEILL